MTTALVALSNQLADRFQLGDGMEAIAVLKATAFKGQVSDAQLMALMMVANQYGLNPWTKELYAYPDKNNGIVPVVGVDGWARIINNHPQFNGIDFEQTDEACTCSIYRKDREQPIRVTEYLAECSRSTGPWQTHPKRMLRHKAMIQCARVAFGYTGIYDPDEAQRILNPERKPAPATKTKQPEPMTIDADTGEIIESDQVQAIEKIRRAATREELGLLWANFGAKAMAAKDRNGWLAVREAVRIRRMELANASEVQHG